MSVHSACLYAYLLFYVDSRQDKKQQQQTLNSINALFDDHKKGYDLDIEDTDYKHPDIKIVISLQKGDQEQGGMSFVMLRFHDVVIVLFQALQGSQKPSTPEDFWETQRTILNVPDIEREIGADAALSKAYLGTTYVYLGQSDTTFNACLKRLGFETTPEKRIAELPFGARLACCADDSTTRQYLILAEREKAYWKTMGFLNRDFPLMDMFRRKIELEIHEARQLEQRSEKYSMVLNDRLDKNTVNDELQRIRAWHLEFQDHLSTLTGIDITLSINARNLQLYLERTELASDTIFAPVLRRCRHVRDQFDCSRQYLELEKTSIDRNLNFLELQLEQERLEQERQLEQQENRIERWIAVIGVAIGVGQIVMSAGEIELLGMAQWQIHLIAMLVSIPGTLLFLEIIKGNLLQRLKGQFLQKNRDKNM